MVVAAALSFAYRELLALALGANTSAASATAIRPTTTPGLVCVLLLVTLAVRRVDIRRALGNPGRYRDACLLLVPAALLLLWAHYRGAIDLMIPSLALAILGSSWLLAGARACRAILPAVAILPFAMPIPAVLRNQIVDALQIASARLVSGFLNLLRVPHVRVDEFLGVGDAGFRVVEECSGLASIGAISLAAVFYVGLFRRPRLPAALLVAVAPLIGLLANALRVLWLTLGDPSRAREEHSLLGLAVIALGALALGVIDRLLGRLPAVMTTAERPPARRRPFAGLPRQRVLFLGAMFATLGVALTMLPPRVPAPSDAAKRLAQIDAALRGFEGVEVEIDREFLGSTGFDATLQRRFHIVGLPVTLFAGIDDRSDRLVSGRSPKTVFPGSDWLPVEREPLALETAGNAEALVLRNAGSRLLVYHWTFGFDSLVSETIRSTLGLEPRRAAPQPGIVLRLSTPLQRVTNARVRADARLRAIIKRLESSLDGL